MNCVKYNIEILILTYDINILYSQNHVVVVKNNINHQLKTDKMIKNIETDQ